MVLGGRWTEDETKLALFLYFQLPFGKLHSGTQEIVQLAAAFGRTPSSVAMKLSNFASLDPKITESGRKGLDGASKLDRQIFARFEGDWTGLVSEADALWSSLVDSAEPPRLRESASPYEFEPYLGDSTYQRIVEQRAGQNFFRRAVLANFESRCCITGIAEARLLNASHIKPWGADVANRHNPANGFALSATFDRAFDRGLITIDCGGEVMVSRHLAESKDDATREYFSRYAGRRVFTPIRFNPDPALLAWHNDNVYLDSVEN